MALPTRTPDQILSPAGMRYAPLMTAFTLVTATLVQLASRREAPPRTGLALAEGALAAFYLTRVVAKEKVGAVVRDPFTEPEPGTDPDDAHGETKQPAGHGLRYTIGELVTCTRCLGPWAGAALTLGHAAAPRQSAFATRILAIAGANTLLQAAQSYVAEAANRQARARS